jgi:3-hydroxyisobutyrate dehydrogenase-like beta-hydroxyacid dehydrogenase
VAESPGEAVRSAEAVITMLADDAALEQAVPAFVNDLPGGALHIGMSTISVALSERLAQLHTAHGQSYIAAPVFGRPSAAEAGKLWVVAAGPGEAVARCQPVFDAVSRGCSVVGNDAWLANVVKLSGNFLIAAVLESLGEAFALVRKYGVDAGQFLEIINNALFQSALYGN